MELDISKDIDKLRAQRAGFQMGQAILQSASLLQGFSKIYLQAIYKIIGDALRTNTIKITPMTVDTNNVASLRDINLKLKNKEIDK